MHKKSAAFKHHLPAHCEQTPVIIKSTLSTLKPAGASTAGEGAGTQKVRPQTRQVAWAWWVAPAWWCNCEKQYFRLPLPSSKLCRRCFSSKSVRARKMVLRSTVAKCT